MTMYILKSSAAIAVAFLLYFLFLRKCNNFKWLRLFFLGAILVSFIFPALKYLPDLHRRELVVVPAEYVPTWIDNQPDVVVTNEYSSVVCTSKVQSSPSSFLQIAEYVYLIGTLFFLLRFIIGLSQLVVLVVRNGVQKTGSDCFVLVRNLPSPFSFFHLIFINRNDLSDARRSAMLHHEREHVRQWHSLDLLLLEVVTAVQWFNPFVWLTSRSLKEIHEYLADEKAARKHVSMLEYQHLLISQASGIEFYLPVNGFNGSLTKKRILMITNIKQNKKWFIIVIALIVTIILIDSMTRIGIIRASSSVFKPKLASAIEIVYPNSSTRDENLNSSLENNHVAIPSDTGKLVGNRCLIKYDTVASPTKNDSTHRTVIAKSSAGSYGYDIAISAPALFYGTSCIEESQKAYNDFIKENLKYPEEIIDSKDSHRTGIVIVSFKIDKTGKVQGVRCYNDDMREYYKNADEKYKDQPDKLARIKRDLLRYTDNPLLVHEAIRVIALQPNYIPAKSRDGQSLETTETRTIQFWNPKDREQNLSYRDYIKENMKYPKDAIDRKAEGVVHLKYDLDKNNHYGNIQLGNEDMRRYYKEKGITKNIEEITDDPALVKEAIRLMKERPGYYIEKFDTTNRVMWGSCSIRFDLPQE